jgi:lysophospholipase L1-like esterase
VKHVPWLICVLGAALSASAFAQNQAKVQFRDSERIALIGNEFFDKEQDQSYIETRLTTRFADKNLVFRNLGYAGDTVRGDARALCAGWANFGPDDQGFNRLRKQVQDARPTLIFVAYGMNESFDGPRGLDRFRQDYAKLLNMLEAETGARMVLITPIAHEQLPPPLPDASGHNRDLTLYAETIRQIGAGRKYPVIDLFKAVVDEFKVSPRPAMTKDGIHLNAYGYWRVAGILEQAMGYPPREWRLELNAKGGPSKAIGTETVHFAATLGLGREFSVRFETADAMLPAAPPPMSAEAKELPGDEGTLRIAGLTAGRYVLKSGDQEIATATADDWARGVQLRAGPAFAQEEHLRKLVIAKNAEYFNFWRPENDTYILGYRNHEQGQNAVELPRFRPLAEQKDAQIAKLRVPEPCKYVLTRLSTN